MQETSRWSDFFDHHAPEYEENVFTQNTLTEVEFLIDVLELEPGMSILDVGCGTGRHAIELAERGFDVIGIDISPGMLKVARRNAEERGVEVTWVEADAQDFELDEPVDAVICLCEGGLGLLGGGDDPIGQPLTILQNIADSLDDGGRCLFTVLNGFALCRRQTKESVEQGRFDPLALAEESDCQSPDADDDAEPLRERGFVPTELVLLLSLADLETEEIWGGTAGTWGKRPVELDEYEIMVLGRKAEEADD